MGTPTEIRKAPGGPRNSKCFVFGLSWSSDIWLKRKESGVRPFYGHKYKTTVFLLIVHASASSTTERPRRRQFQWPPQVSFLFLPLPVFLKNKKKTATTNTGYSARTLSRSTRLTRSFQQKYPLCPLLLVLTFMSVCKLRYLVSPDFWMILNGFVPNIDVRASRYPQADYLSPCPVQSNCLCGCSESTQQSERASDTQACS